MKAGNSLHNFFITCFAFIFAFDPIIKCCVRVMGSVKKPYEKAVYFSKKKN